MVEIGLGNEVFWKNEFIHNIKFKLGRERLIDLAIVQINY